MHTEKEIHTGVGEILKKLKAIEKVCDHSIDLVHYPIPSLLIVFYEK